MYYVTSSVNNLALCGMLKNTSHSYKIKSHRSITVYNIFYKRHTNFGIQNFNIQNFFLNVFIEHYFFKYMNFNLYFLHLN